MHFVGLDLAWGEKKQTGVAAIDLNGRLLENLVDRQMDPNRHDLLFSTEKLPLGTYQVYIQKKSGNETVKFVKLKTN